MDGLATHNPVSQLLRIPDESMSGIELRYGVPPLLTSAARLNELVEITMHELAGKESHRNVVAISCNCKARYTGRRRCLENRVKCFTAMQTKMIAEISRLFAFEPRWHWYHRSRLVKRASASASELS